MINNQSLATKYRPQKLSEVCGQGITVKILEKAIQNKSFKNAYLFTGDSGCGKTSLSRLLANAINQGIGEPIEIDAASNNGIDQVRAIIESADQRSLVGEYKIFIIDECHAITSQGWQAFLKTLEEPPAYTIFMFCTTEPSKIPQTILNRVQRFTVTKIPSEQIKERLIYICKQEGFTNYEMLCDLLSKVTNGCMRDAITYLEQCASYSTDLSIDNAKQVVAQLSYEPLFRLTWAILQKNESEIFSSLEACYNNGIDLKAFIDNYLTFILNLFKYAKFNDISTTNLPEYLATAENPVIQHTVKMAADIQIFSVIADTLLKIKQEIKYDANCLATIEAFLLRLCRN